MSITKNNYEEWMVAFVDGELTPAEQLEFTNFLEKNPALKEELAIFQSLQFEADEEIVFKQKEILYKKTPGLVLLKRAWPLAAMIILLLGILPFIKNDNTDDVGTKTVAQKNTKIVDTPETKNKAAVVLENKVAEEKLAPVQPRTRYTTPVVVEAPRKKESSKSSYIAANKNKNYAAPKAPKQILEAEKTQESEQVVQKINMGGVLPPEPEGKKEAAPEIIIVKQEEYENSQKKEAKTIEFESLKPVKRRATILVISEESNPAIHEKLNEVITKVEGHIETIQELKRTPITVCIGKRKLFTLNTAKAAQAN